VLFIMDVNAELGRLRRVLADLVRSGRVRVDRAKAGALAALQRRMPSAGYDAFFLVVGRVDAAWFAAIRRAARVGVGADPCWHL
jgi:hypothetical protein